MKTGEFGLILVVAESGVEGWYASAHARATSSVWPRAAASNGFLSPCYNISYVVLLYVLAKAWMDSVASAACL